VGRDGEIRNRFNGFVSVWETVETVGAAAATQ
jgi:hypothetical protein